jgi:hypothetical protein
MNQGKRGKPFEYPTNFIKFLAPVRVFFRLPYRQEEGFVEALSKLVPELEVPATQPSTAGSLPSSLSSSEVSLTWMVRLL